MEYKGSVEAWVGHASIKKDMKTVMT